MNKIIVFFSGLMLTLGGLFMYIILGTLMGGIGGWVVGLVFGDTILNFAGQLGVHGLSMFQLGVSLGFVGGFLKTKVTATVSPEKK